MTNKINFKKLKQLRENKGWTQFYLATAAKLDRSTIIRMETGKKKYFSLETIKSVASALDIDFTELLDSQNDNRHIVLNPLGHGKLIDELFFNKNGTEFDYENSITNTDTLTVVFDFFNFLDSHIEAQLKWPQKMSPAQLATINQFIEKFKQKGLLIFGGEYIDKHLIEGFESPYPVHYVKIWIGSELNRHITKSDLNNPFIASINPN